MDMNELKLSAKVIVKRNLTEHVVFASILWDGNNRKLRLCYYVDKPVVIDNEEWDASNDAIDELISNYPEVCYGANECFEIYEENFSVKEPEIIVYSRDEAS